MPLNRIRELLKLKDTGLDIEPILDLHRTVFGIKKDQGFNLTRYCEETGLTSKQVKELIRKKLLFPHGENQFDTEDISIGRVYAWSFKEGIKLEDLEFQARYAELMVDVSIDLSLKLTGDMPFEKAAEVKRQLVTSMITINMYLKAGCSNKSIYQRSYPAQLSR